MAKPTDIVLGDGDVQIKAADRLVVLTSDLELWAEANAPGGATKKPTTFRRALKHGPNDALVLNWNGDYATVLHTGGHRQHHRGKPCVSRAERYRSVGFFCGGTAVTRFRVRHLWRKHANFRGNRWRLPTDANHWTASGRGHPRRHPCARAWPSCRSRSRGV